MNGQQLLFGEWAFFFVKQKCDEQRCSLSEKMTSLKLLVFECPKLSSWSV